MLSRRIATVLSARDEPARGLQIVSTDLGSAINFPDFCGPVCAGERVLLNRTAVDMALGTGGCDYVAARVRPEPVETAQASRLDGHIMKLRYTPLQHSAAHIEDDEEFCAISDRGLCGLPVVACELHSQIAPAAAAASTPAGYAMTDSAALSLGISELAQKLTSEGILGPCIAVGQAFAPAGAMNAVTLHNALLCLRHRFDSPIAVVAPGPGNTGTNTKYGFSGIEQAATLDTIAALGGQPIACVRVSSADTRARHRGISHHTRTVLELVRSRVVVALPDTVAADEAWRDRHDVRVVAAERTRAVLDRLAQHGIDVRSMGRSAGDDALFFESAAAAGVIAAQMAAGGSM